VSGRLKELYPLWVKMEARASADGGMKTLSADVVALRVILDVAQRPGEAQEDWKTRGVWLCYHALGLVQHLPESRLVPSQVKDYISFPKPNGYQSLHTSIIRGGQTIEVQIRTSWMHAVAEYGMAAHWLYKDERYGTSSASKVFNKYQVSWLETVKEWDEIHNSTEFLSVIVLLFTCEVSLTIPFLIFTFFLFFFFFFFFFFFYLHNLVRRFAESSLGSACLSSCAMARF
jgi:GTP pyrophosphokinase